MSKKLSSREVASLRVSGHVVTSCRSARAFDELAFSLGTPIQSRSLGPLKDVLEVKEKEEALTRSLSGVFGKGQFPFHTDMAHMQVPPRFVLLRSVGVTNSRKTFVMDVSTNALSKSWIPPLEHDIWFVDGGKESFLTPILNTSLIKNERIFRYDAEVMRPADRTEGESIRVMQFLKTALPYVEYVLDRNECLVIDNWQTLHARGAEPAKSDKDSRKLERYLVIQAR